MAINSATLLVFLLTLTILGPFCNADYVLGTNERLESGASLQYGGYRLTMQGDCNLVLYDNGNPVWSTNTFGASSGCYCVMQSDGNLVVYRPDGGAIWASNTARDGGNYVLVLQKDRNLVIYGSAIWASNSYTVSLTSGNDTSTTIVNAAADTHRIPAKVDLNTTSHESFSSE